MWPSSSWKNPTATIPDREKPEVVAVGATVTSLGPDNTPMASVGTSDSAPLVSGLAALLMERNSQLTVSPEALRAIIMATATHNFEDKSIPGLDLRAGAGGVNADLADTVAQTGYLSTQTCPESCWWDTDAGNQAFNPVSSISRYFVAKRGQPTRVAMSWWSNANCPYYNYPCTDSLDTDLDLYVFDPAGKLVASSGSFSNNYELVDFDPTLSGTYEIRITKTSVSNEEHNMLGIAVSQQHLKFIFLPEIDNNPFPAGLNLTVTPPVIFVSPTPCTRPGPCPPTHPCPPDLSCVVTPTLPPILPTPNRPPPYP